ncbi:VENN motif pre-toxin domain-containing protein [Glaesserella parasuis]|nr:hypothetical protein HPSSW114_0689 [Glaesserella parasuis SW114]MDD2173637.1 VENN motif pre-toxin domain-containing protein [Glaesserella parasuis]MDP0273869.1 VENN motif pre-toxin domain-containing protein [Glaesserella parasuis]MDP0307854.1 VENN motif pre-toxin domain-containing protein [Glaesserella parasuis]MDP0472634.1 VENN motif pre-toxin domain-containing protein [Glaesserella parasuis]
MKKNIWMIVISTGLALGGTPTEGNETANILAHGVWGAMEAASQGGSALGGAAAAMTGEVGAKLLAEQLYGQSNPEHLSTEQKQTLSELSQVLAGATAGTVSGATGGNSLTAVQAVATGMGVAKSAVENNLLLADYSGLKGLTKTETEKHRKTMQLLKDNGIENIDDYAKYYSQCSTEQCEKDSLEALNKAFDKAYDIDEYTSRIRGAYDSKRFSDNHSGDVYFSGVINVLGKNEDRLNQARLYATVSDLALQGYSQEQIEEKLKEQNFAVSMSSSGISLSSNTERGRVGRKPTVTSSQISKIIESVQGNIHLTLNDAFARLKDRVRNEVTVYRVEGIPNQRLIINNAGDVFIIGNKTLYLNFGSKKRALEYLQQKIEKGLPNAELKSFIVPREYREVLKGIAVPEKDIRTLDPSRVRPVIADPTKAKYQYGLREGQIEELKSKIILGSGKNGN